MILRKSSVGGAVGEFGKITLTNGCAVLWRMFSTRIFFISNFTSSSVLKFAYLEGKFKYSKVLSN